MSRLPAASMKRAALPRWPFAVVIATAIVLHALDARAATYKWVDEKGVVHYTDKLPADAVNRGNVEISKDGVPLRKMDPAPTAEQRRAREQEEERRKLLARQQEEVARKDRALLASYTSESEIDIVRARAVSTIETVLQSIGAYTEQLNRRKAELEQKMATFKKQPPPPVYQTEMETINEELGRQAELASAKRKEIAAMNAKYDTDKARWREIAAAKQARDAALAVPTAAAPAVK